MSALTPSALYAPPISPCVADRSTRPPFFDHAADLFKHAKEAAKEFANAGLVASGGSTRAKDGGRAMRMLRRMRDKFPDPKVNKQELQHMLALSMMCGWRRAALKYARELLDEDACRDDDGCYCATAGHIVSLLRQTQKSFVAAETFFEKRVARAQRCTQRLERTLEVVARRRRLWRRGCLPQVDCALARRRCEWHCRHPRSRRFHGPAAAAAYVAQEGSRRLRRRCLRSSRNIVRLHVERCVIVAADAA